jgi:hypothetical protein
MRNEDHPVIDCPHRGCVRGRRDYEQRLQEQPSHVVRSDVQRTAPSHRFPPPWSVEELDALEGGAQARLICYNLIASEPRASEWEVHHVAREASFEAKESDESRNGIGSRWGVVAGGRRIGGSRWSGRRYTDGELGTGNYSR